MTGQIGMICFFSSIIMITLPLCSARKQAEGSHNTLNLKDSDVTLIKFIHCGFWGETDPSASDSGMSLFHLLCSPFIETTTTRFSLSSSPSKNDLLGRAQEVLAIAALRSDVRQSRSLFLEVIHTPGCLFKIYGRCKPTNYQDHEESR